MTRAFEIYRVVHGCDSNKLGKILEGVVYSPNLSDAFRFGSKLLGSRLHSVVLAE